jgi:hypothetical protein
MGSGAVSSERTSIGGADTANAADEVPKTGGSKPCNINCANGITPKGVKKTGQ